MCVDKVVWTVYVCTVNNMYLYLYVQRMIYLYSHISYKTIIYCILITVITQYFRFVSCHFASKLPDAIWKMLRKWQCLSIMYKIQDLKGISFHFMYSVGIISQYNIVSHVNCFFFFEINNYINNQASLCMHEVQEKHI